MIFAIVIAGQSAFAVNESPQTFTLDGQLFKAGTSTPLQDGAVKLTVQVMNSNGTCLLYEEQQTVNTLATDGYFNINVGSQTGASKRTVNDPGRTMNQVFQNIAAISANSMPGQTCAGGIYTPSQGAIRYLRITVTPSSTNVADTLSPDLVIDSVPNAVVAQSLQGLERSGVLQVNSSGSTLLTQANLEAAFTTPAYTNLQAILAGNFIKTDSSGATLPSYASNPSSPANGEMWFDSTTGQIKYQNSSGVQTVGAAGGGTISSLTVGSSMSVNGTVAGTISSGSGSIDLTNTGVASGTYTKVTVDTKGRVTAGTVSLVEADIPNLTVAGKVSGDTITSGTISGSASVNTTGNLVTTATVSGLTVQATNLRVYNGANYVQMTAGAISSNLTLTLPVNNGNAGDVLSTDGTGVLSWISALTSSLTSGKILVGNGSNVATAVYLSGDATLSNAGILTLANTGVSANTYTKVTVDAKGRVTAAANITSSDVTTALGYTPLNAASATLAGDVSGAFGSTSVDKIKGKAVTAGSVSGQVMIYDGTQWVNNVVSGDATLSYTGILSLNKVPVSKGGTNSTSFGNNHIIVSNSTGTALVDATCSLNQVLSFDSSGYAVCSNVSSLVGGSAIVNGGNTTGADISIGTNDNKALALKVNNSTAVTISQNGNVGIGTNNPADKLYVAGGKIGMDNDQNIYFRDTTGTANSSIKMSSADNFQLTNNGAGNIQLTVNNDTSNIAFLTGKTVQSTKMIITNAGNVGVGTSAPSSALDVSGAITAEGMSAAPSVAGSNAGRIYYDYSANKFKISQNGSAYVDLVGAGSITSIGGQTGAAQSLAISVDNSVATPTITSASDTHTWKIPMASNTGTTAGLLNKTDYDSFVAKLGTATVFAGDVSGTYNSTTVQKIQGKAVTAASVSGQMMIYDGTQWVNNVMSGDATIAYTGILTLNKVPVSKGGTNATSFGANRVIASNGTGSALTDITCSLNQVLAFDASGYVVCANVSSLSGAILNGGNTTGSDISIGTNDNKALAFKVNNATAMTISQGGNVGIGITSPTSLLHIERDANSSTSALTKNTSNGSAAEAALLVQNDQGYAGLELFSSGWGIASLQNKALFTTQSTVTGGLGFATLGSAPITFATNSASGWQNERMRIDSAGNIGVGTPLPTSALDVSGAFTAEGMSSAPSVSASNTGRIYYDYSTNKFRISQNGAAYVDLVGAGSITSIGGQTGASQSLAISVDNSVATPTISSASNTHTWKFPMASNAGTTAGLLSKTDYDNFNTKLGTTTSFAGDVSGAYNSTIVQKIQGKAVTAGSVSGQVMIYDGTQWVNNVVSGDATLSYAGILTLNKVPVSKGGTNATSFGANRVIASNGTGSALTDITCSLNQVLSFDASGYVVCANVSSLSGAILNGGNTTGADISIGTNDNKALNFKVNNNTIAMTISQNGGVAIGTTSVDLSAYLTIHTGIPRFAMSLENSNTGGIPWYIGSTDNSWSSGGGKYVISKSTVASNANFTIDSSGNVGINTAFPTTAMDVSGAITAEGMSSAPSNSASNTGRIYYDYATNKFKVSQNGSAYVDLVSAAATSGFLNGGNSFGASASLGTNDNNALYFKTNNSTAVTISQNGYVGIGTSPGYGFHVKRDIQYYTDNSGNPYLYLTGGNVAVASSATPYSKLTVGGNAAIGSGYSGTAAPTNGMIVQGNVGLGLSSPSTALDISGALTAEGMSSAPSVAGSNTGVIYYDYSANKFKVSQNGGGYVDLISAAATTGFLNGGNSFGADATLGTNDNKALSFKTNNTTAVTISQGGNVGIGTTSLTQMLNVGGNIQMTSAGTQLSSAGTQLLLQQTGDTLGTTSLALQNRTGLNGALFQNSAVDLVDFGFLTSTSAQSNIRFEHRSTKLGNANNTTGEFQFIDSNNTAPNLPLIVGKNAIVLGAPAYSSFYANTANVGIGTLTPTTALDISGALTAEGMSSAPSVSGSNTGRIYYDYSANKFKVSQNGGAYVDLVSASASNFTNGGNAFGTNATLGTTDNRPLTIITNNTTAMTISQNGKVGIGTTTPPMPLTIMTSSGSGGMYISGNSTDPATYPAIGTIEHNLGGYNPTLSVVNGGGDTVATVAAINTNSTGSVLNYGFMGVGSRSFWTGGPSPVVSGDYLPGLAWAGLTNSTPGSGTVIGALVTGQVDNTVSSGAMPTSIVFQTSTTNHNGLTERMRINSAGAVAIGTSTPGASSLLELSSTTKGFVLPRMTKAQRDAIASPVAGMAIFQTDNTPGLRVYNGTNWMRFTETAD